LKYYIIFDSKQTVFTILLQNQMSAYCLAAIRNRVFMLSRFQDIYVYIFAKHTDNFANPSTIPI